jgi:hypothetical protein
MYAHVYVGVIKMLARRSRSFEPHILGHVIAHEMGHLLLGTKAHSVGGLMRAHWRESEKDRAAQGGLQFLDAEAKRMRANYQTYVKTREPGNARCENWPKLTAGPALPEIPQTNCVPRGSESYSVHRLRPAEIAVHRVTVQTPGNLH